MQSCRILIPCFLKVSIAVARYIRCGDNLRVLRAASAEIDMHACVFTASIKYKPICMHI